MNQERLSSKGRESFSGEPTRSTRLIGGIAAVVATLGLFQAVATGFTSSAATQIAKAHTAKVIVASAR